MERNVIKLTALLSELKAQVNLKLVRPGSYDNMIINFLAATDIITAIITIIIVTPLLLR